MLVSGCLSHGRLCLWGGGLFRRGIHFGEAHVQDVPLQVSHPLLLDGQWPLELCLAEPAKRG